ncbi:peptidylprolyl isomerase [Ignatzschineria cameli]|uniref:Peptidyl-prolyl cis-trans isomerase n=1 Tax=Ignatzschineria cameli TaxID=2182793 RepID=A0A2U2APP8_9GAMM|nr:peptidylprolyl isomerase [Ignatzschineria cameli]PWD83375.1 cyclophilin [Ignatzschineria cameli]PWD85493.1 cyclophilin [Ignatzschineria cameli]PWD89193.1 cyclophilin [Ignatzschineria cameli]PWD90633.1 cyclophilin [Ignatzschineria cameli]PWD91337.1 cyclophilin [Ignatzschineria cameli]
MLKFHTTMGDFTIALNHEKAPVTAENFLQYAKDGYFNGTLFHRIIPGFMVQGGGLEPGMVDKHKGHREPIQNEADNGLKNVRGSVAMARTMDPHSATSQFFINLVDNSFLDHKSQTPQGWGYAVFGEVVEGMDVIDKMAKVETTSRRGHGDVPVEDIIIENVEVISE